MAEYGSLDMTLKEILESSVEERHWIIGVIWDSLTAETDDLPMTSAQREDLKRRLAEHRENKDEGYTWDEAYQQITGESRPTRTQQTTSSGNDRGK